MTITLDAIKAEHTRLAEMIAAFEAQPAPRIITIAGAMIDLQPNEHYAGIVLDDDGRPAHHVVLIPGETKGTWEEAKTWAAAAGGDLPTRREQSLLFANCKRHFESAWYWSSEQHAEDPACAWGQDFGGGHQDGLNASWSGGRARAVRRLPIL